jgi:(p)ppGpp synthase/HD superfamily hydrolase
MRELGLSMVDCMVKIEKIAFVISYLQDMNLINFGKAQIAESKDVAAFLQMFLYSLNSLNSPDAQIIYFAQVLTRLRHTPVNELSTEDEKHFRIVVATMAERCGHSKFAAEIRDELFRITHNKEYRKMRAAIEKAFGLKYPEMEAHVQTTADLIKDVLAAVKISPDQYKISARVKLPYSSWEKMQSLQIKNPGLLKDLFGVSLIVKDDAMVYRIIDLIRQAFVGIYHESTNDRPRIARFLKKTGVGEFVDQIQAPRKSGFSALFYHCRTELGLPIEIQVTSEKRQKVNKGGAAAHWKHKIRREVKASYGIEMGEIDDLKDRDDNLVL